MVLYNQYQRAPSMKSFSVYDEIKKELINGKWGFGQKISVNDLIDRFNVSRRPVMDALKILETDGFIEIIPQSGCKVVDYSRKRIIDQLLLSASIESLSAEFAALHHTPEEFNQFEKHHLSFLEHSEKLNDNEYYFQYNREFHLNIAIMSHSERITTSAMQMWDLNDFYLHNFFEKYNVDAREPLEYHNQILESIRTRNAEQAKIAMEKHLRKYAETISSYLPE